MAGADRAGVRDKARAGAGWAAACAPAAAAGMEGEAGSGLGLGEEKRAPSTRNSVGRLSSGSFFNNSATWHQVYTKLTNGLSTRTFLEEEKWVDEAG